MEFHAINAVMQGELDTCSVKEAMFRSSNPLRRDGHLPTGIGILTSGMNEEADLDLIRCIAAQADRMGIDTKVRDTGGSLVEEERQLIELLEMNVGGLILLPTDCHHTPDRLHTARCPVVLVGQQYVDPLSATFVGIDNYAMAQRAFERLQAVGCERIGFLAESDRQYSTQQRVFGYRIAVADSRNDQQPVLLAVGRSDAGDIRRIHRALSEKKLDGVICDSSSGCELLSLALELMPGSIADQLQVVTFANRDWQGLERSCVSAVTRPIELIAGQALQSLIQRLNSTKPDRLYREEIFLGAEIVELSCKWSPDVGLNVNKSSRCAVRRPASNLKRDSSNRNYL